MRLVVKIGSSSIEGPETGQVNTGFMEEAGLDIQRLVAEGHEVVLVTSGYGAVGGSKEVEGVKDRATRYRWGRNAVGGAWRRVLGHVACGDRLISRGSLSRDADRIRRRMARGLVDVVNAHHGDPVFANNDDVAAELAVAVGADKVLYVTSSGGFFTGFNGADSCLVEHMGGEEVAHYRQFVDGKTASGTGGMDSKLEAAARLAGLGIGVEIAASIMAAFNGKGTTIQPVVREAVAV